LYRCMHGGYLSKKQRSGNMRGGGDLFPPV